MSDFEPGQVPTSGSLSAKIIRKCPTHSDCPLTCKHRRVEDLGEIANFDRPPDDSFLNRLKEGLRQWHR